MGAKGGRGGLAGQAALEKRIDHQGDQKFRPAPTDFELWNKPDLRYLELHHVREHVKGVKAWKVTLWFSATSDTLIPSIA